MTWWPLAVSSRTVEGTSPTRYSLSLISFGTPTSMMTPPDRSQRKASTGASLCDERIRPAQPPEAGEIAVGRAQGEPVFDGKCCEMRVGDEVAVHARQREQLA